VRLRDLRGLPVIAVDDASELGHVAGVVVEPSTATVVAYTIAPGGVVPFGSAASTGTDAVMVPNPSVVREAATPTERRAAEHDLQLLGQLVLTDHGDALGPLVDLQIDVETGRVLGLALADRMLAGDDLVGVGTFTVVVRHRDDDRPSLT